MSSSEEIGEYMAVAISREINDYECVWVGTGLDVPRVGVFLAHLTRCPNLRLLCSFYMTNWTMEEKIGTVQFVTDPRVIRASEAMVGLESQFDDSNSIDVFFVGGMQIDMYGNTNLIGIGSKYSELKLRGPGPIATTLFATYAKRYYIYTATHDKRVFVPKCDFVSAPGWISGSDSRQKLGLPGGGPRKVFTPLCILNFEELTKRMRLEALFPPATIEDVLNNTGFELIVPKNVGIVKPPTSEELKILRTRVDPDGVLRRRESVRS